MSTRISRSRRVRFYATRADCEPGLQRFETEFSVQYVLSGLFPHPEIVTYATWAELPDFGRCSSGSMLQQPRYMVLPTNHRVGIEPIPQRRGGLLYSIDQVWNHPAAFLVPSGLYEDNALIEGELLASTDPRSRSIQQSLARRLLRGWTHFHDAYLGPEARRLFDAGYRLTQEFRKSPVYDLAEP